MQENLEHAKQFFDAISDLVLIKGEKSRIVWANKAFREYYGMDSEKLRGMIDASFNEPDNTLQYIKDDTYVFTTGKTLDIPSEAVTCFDNAVRYFHTVKSAICDESGKVILTIGVSRDITDEKAAKELLTHKSGELASLNKLMIDRELTVVELKKDVERLKVATIAKFKILINL